MSYTVENVSFWRFLYYFCYFCVLWSHTAMLVWKQGSFNLYSEWKAFPWFKVINRLLAWQCITHTQQNEVGNNFKLPLLTYTIVLLNISACYGVTEQCWFEHKEVFFEIPCRNFPWLLLWLKVIIRLLTWQFITHIHAYKKDVGNKLPLLTYFTIILLCISVHVCWSIYNCKSLQYIPYSNTWSSDVCGGLPPIGWCIKYWNILPCI